MRSFDVFLSYSSTDEAWVRRLAKDLKRYGVSVWLDRDEIRPGDLFAKALEQGLEQSRAVALVVSPESMASGWVEQEYYRALSLAQRKNDALQLIPVLLHTAELPGFSAKGAIDRVVEVILTPAQQHATNIGRMYERIWAA